MRTYAHVIECFTDRTHPQSVIERLVHEWAMRNNVVGYPTPCASMPVRHETWTHEQVGEHLDRLALLQPLLITDDKPRRMDGPLVLVDFGRGRIGQIDGRRRANIWRNTPGSYEVLTLCAY